MLRKVRGGETRNIARSVIKYDERTHPFTALSGQKGGLVGGKDFSTDLEWTLHRYTLFY